MKRPNLCATVDVVQRGSGGTNVNNFRATPSPEVESDQPPFISSGMSTNSPVSLSPTSSPQSRMDQGKRMLQSAAASFMTMSLSPPVNKTHKKQSSVGGIGGSVLSSPCPSPTPQHAAKIAKSAPKSNALFNRPLEEICHVRPAPDGRVEIPFILTSVCAFIESHGLENEGLFRVNGNSKTLDRLRVEYEKGDSVDLKRLGVDVASAAGLMKMFLREIPEPVVPGHAHKLLLKEWYKLQNLCAPHTTPPSPTNSGQFSMSSDFIPIAIAILKQHLSIQRLAVLGFICYFLFRVSLAKDRTKMGSTALGIVFGPNLFRVDTSQECIKEQGTLNDMLSYFIENAESIFAPPGKLSVHGERSLLSVPDSTKSMGLAPLSISCPLTPNPPPTPAPTPTAFYGSSPAATPTAFAKTTPNETDAGIPRPPLTAGAPIFARSSSPLPPVGAPHVSVIIASGDSDSTLPSDRDTSPQSSRSSIEKLGASNNALVTRMAAQIVDQTIQEVVDSFLAADSKDCVQILPGISVMATRTNSSTIFSDRSPTLSIRSSARTGECVDDQAMIAPTTQRDKALSQSEIFSKSPRSFSPHDGGAYTLAPNHIATVESMTSSESSDGSSEDSASGSDDDNITDSSSKPVFFTASDNRPPKLESTPKKPYVPPLDLTTLGEHYDGNDPIPSRQKPSIVGNGNGQPSRSLQQAWGELKDPKGKKEIDPFRLDKDQNTLKSHRSHYTDNLTIAARDALGSGGLASSSSGGSSPAIDIPGCASNGNVAREGEASAHGRAGVHDEAVISPRTSRFLSRHNNNNNSNGKKATVTALRIEKRSESIPGPKGHESEDTDVPPSPPLDKTRNFKSAFNQKLSNKKWPETDDNSNASKVRQYTKKISHLKRKIKIWEENFEMENGFKWNSVNARDGQAARAAGNNELGKLMAELSKTRKELKVLKEAMAKEKLIQAKASALDLVGANLRVALLDKEETPDLGSGSPAEVSASAPVKEGKKTTMEETLNKISLQLKDKRRSMNRSEDLQNLSKTEIEDEKLALQKALLYFENIHGRPVTKEEKDLMRPIYDRYRNVKRMLARPASPKLNNLNSLQPIIEGQSVEKWELAPNVSSTPSTSTFSNRTCTVVHVHCASVDDGVDDDDDDDDGGEENVAPPGVAAIVGSEGAKGLWTNISEASLHEASVAQLLEYQRKAKAEKKRLRRILKDFEDRFQENAGRKVMKEDRGPMESEYADYKRVKQCLRLLEALLSKHGNS